MKKLLELSVAELNRQGVAIPESLTFSDRTAPMKKHLEMSVADLKSRGVVIPESLTAAVHRAYWEQSEAVSKEEALGVTQTEMLHLCLPAAAVAITCAVMETLINPYLLSLVRHLFTLLLIHDYKFKKSQAL
jgi:hypothetical protein